MAHRVAKRHASDVIGQTLPAETLHAHKSALHKETKRVNQPPPYSFKRDVIGGVPYSRIGVVFDRSSTDPGSELGDPDVLDRIEEHRARPESERLRPYIASTSRQRPSFFRKWIRGGVFAVALPYILAGVVITIGWNILWVTEVIPPEIIPVNELWLRLTTFIVGLTLGTKFINGNGRYRDARKQFGTTIGSMTNLILSITSTMDLELISAHCGEKREDDKRCKQISDQVYRLMHYSRSLPYALKWDFRRNIIPELLPIPRCFQNELRCFDSEEEFSYILHEIMRSIRVLVGIGIFPVQMLGATIADIKAINNGYTAVKVTQTAEDPPAYRFHSWAVIAIYFTFTFFHLFPFYGWYGVGVAAYLVYAILGLILAAQAVSNPFDSPEDNAFMSEVMIGHDVDGEAKLIDAHYLALLKAGGLYVNWCNGCIEKCDKTKISV